MNRYIFTVEGLPPKKDGANSMWGKPLEAKRLVALRQAAYNAMNGQAPLCSKIKLSIELHIPRNSRSTGDLDSFITGVCDGLMGTLYGGKLDDIWQNENLNDIHPTKTIAIVDDSDIIWIQAEKIIDDGKQWYKVVLEGE